MPAPSEQRQRHPRDHRMHAAAPIVAYGDGAARRLPDHVVALGARRVLLICGRRSFEVSGAANILPGLRDVAKLRRWSDFGPNTDSADLREGLGVLREFDPDLVLGVGGGSALDMAKLLCAYRDVPDDQVLEAITSGRRVESRRNRLFLVPTTSGSGAEATHFAVVYVGDDKYSSAGPGLRADAIALDPMLSVTGSPYQRATSGIDAVSQAIESLWAVAATDRSRFFARIALRLLLPAIERFVHQPTPDCARAMCLGSHFAGRAIDISRTTAAHALSYAITKKHGVSHGHAVALTLSAFLRAHANAGPDRLHERVDFANHRAAINDILHALGAQTGGEASNRFTDLLRRLQLEPSLTRAGADTPMARKAIAASVNAERLANNPVLFSEHQLAILVDGIH